MKGLDVLSTTVSVLIETVVRLVELTNNASLVDIPSSTHCRVRIPLSLCRAILAMEDSVHSDDIDLQVVQLKWSETLDKMLGEVRLFIDEAEDYRLRDVFAVALRPADGMLFQAPST